MTKKELLKRIIALEKRYATHEEIDLLEPKQKELEIGKWYHADDVIICITSINEDKLFGYGLNPLKNHWIEEDDNPWYTFQIK